MRKNHRVYKHTSNGCTTLISFILDEEGRELIHGDMTPACIITDSKTGDYASYYYDKGLPINGPEGYFYKNTDNIKNIVKMGRAKRHGEYIYIEHFDGYGNYTYSKCPISRPRIRNTPLSVENSSADEFEYVYNLV